MRPLMTPASAVCAVTVIAGAALAACGGPSAVSQHSINCGSATSASAVRCFDAALRNCRAASITEIAMLVDTGTRHIFTTEPGTAPCRVSEQSQHYVVTGGIHYGPVTRTHCSVEAVAATRVELTCGGQHTLIPGEAQAHSEAES